MPQRGVFRKSALAKRGYFPAIHLSDYNIRRSFVKNTSQISMISPAYAICNRQDHRILFKIWFLCVKNCKTFVKHKLSIAKTGYPCYTLLIRTLTSENMPDPRQKGNKTHEKNSCDTSCPHDAVRQRLAVCENWLLPLQAVEYVGNLIHIPFSLNVRVWFAGPRRGCSSLVWP